MPRRVFDELGGFDEDFFVSHEDVDLSYRARLLGYRCRYVADAVVRHHGSVTIGRVSGFAIFHGQRNLEWLYVKNTPLTLLMATLPSHVIYMAAAGLHFARKGALGPFLGRSSRPWLVCPGRFESAARSSGRVVSGAAAAAAAARDAMALDQAARKALRHRAGRRQPMTPEVSAILVNYNAGRDLRARVALDRGRLRDDSVGGGGRRQRLDRSAAQPLWSRFPRRALIRNSTNVGFGRAVNQAVGHSKAPLLLLMNPDCRLLPGAISTLQLVLAAMPSCAVVGPKILDPKRGSAGERARRSGHADGTLRSHWRSSRSDAVPSCRPAKRGRRGRRSKRRVERRRRLVVWRMFARASRCVPCRWRIRRAFLPVLGRCRPVPPASRTRLRDSIRAGRGSDPPGWSIEPDGTTLLDSSISRERVSVLRHACGARSPESQAASRAPLLGARCWWQLRASRSS